MAYLLCSELSCANDGAAGFDNDADFCIDSAARFFINDGFDPIFNVVGALMRGALLARYPAMNQRLLAPAQTST